MRHGDYHQLPDTPSAHQPFPLTAAGEDQARQGVAKLQQALAVNGWALHPVIDSSRLLRGWQTANIIAKEIAPFLPDAPVVESFDELAERGLGSAANLSMQQIESVLEVDPRCELPPPDWKSNSHYRLPLQGAESLLEAGSRVAKHLEWRMRACKHEATRDTLKLFVGHGAAFRHAAYRLGVLEFEQIAQLSMFHAQPIHLEYLSDGVWRHVTGDWKIRAAQESPD